MLLVKVLLGRASLISFIVKHVRVDDMSGNGIMFMQGLSDNDYISFFHWYDTGRLLLSVLDAV